MHIELHSKGVLMGYFGAKLHSFRVHGTTHRVKMQVPVPSTLQTLYLPKGLPNKVSRTKKEKQKQLFSVSHYIQLGSGQCDGELFI